MMKLYNSILAFIITTTLFSQTKIIASQDFDESNPQWHFTTNVSFFDHNSDGFFGIHNGDNDADSNDTGISQNANNISNQNIENDFLFINDLNDEGDNGTNNEAIINFESIDLNSYQNVQIYFDFDIIAFDNSDYIIYEIIEDEIITFRDTLPKNEIGTLQLELKNKTKELLFSIIIKQNGVTEYAAIDNIRLSGSEIISCSELMISEYVEGSSLAGNRNNFIEIYNPTDQNIDLTNYNLTKFTNDNLEPTGEVSLIGTIDPYGTYLIEDETENIGVTANLSTSSSVMDFNGNDKIALRKVDEIIDLIGIVGDDTDFAKDVTLRRKSDIQNPNNQFNESEWDMYGLEDLSNINTHVTTCSGPIPEIEIYGNKIEIIDGSRYSNSTNNTYFGGISPESQNGISKSFTIKNVGSDVLEINNMDIIGINSVDFSLENSNSQNIIPNDSLLIQVNFKPLSQGIKTATIQINNNDASESPFDFIIQGEGTGVSNSPLMITQYYEGDGNNKWLEVTNISESSTQDGLYFLALFMNDDAKSPFGIKPSRKIAIPELEPGQTIKYSATLNVNTPEYAIDGNEIKTTVCIFNGDDIIIISTTDDETCWENKVDIIGNSNNWGSNKSYVRKYGCEKAEPSTGFYIEDWLEYEISDINSATAKYNLRLGEHYVGNTTFNNSENWDNGLPDMYRNVVIESDYNTSLFGNLDVCNLTINNNAIVEVYTNNYISIINNLNVTGTLNVLDKASLMMINDFGQITNNGNINIHKTTNTIKKHDYTYWSSPVKNANLSEVFASSPQDSFYLFETINFSDENDDGYDDDSNSWQRTSGEMEIGKGYTAMAPNTNPFVDKQSVVFSGVVNNGSLNVPIYKSNDNNNENDDWNLIGNPYPSAISADSLLNNEINKTILNGSIYFWTHNTAANNNQYSSDDYAMYTINTGGIMATSQGQIPTKYIASGQGFFVEAIQQGSLQFNNRMRVKDGNDNFFKTESNKNNELVQKDKIWINLYNEQGAFSQILIGFLDGATNQYDSNYDGLRLDANNYLSFFSLVENQKLAIQGLPLFHGDETIPLGFTSKIEKEITLKISIDHAEGIFNDKNIYLFDKKLNKIHLLNKEEYEFQLREQGSFKDRFSLQFSNAVLNINEEELDNDEKLVILKDGNILEIKTTKNSMINSLHIYDVLGRTMIQKKTNKELILISNNSLSSNGVYILHVKLNDSRTLIKKFIP